MTTRHVRDGAHRRLTVGRLTVRDAAPPDGAPPDAPAPTIVEGIAVPYGVIYRHAGDVGPGAERFARGAFARDVERWSNRADGARLPFLDQHGGDVIGTVDELTDTPEGLRFRAALFDDEPAAERYARRARRGVNGVSVEFDSDRSRRMASPVGVEHLAASLAAIAGSNTPAYDGARIAVRSRAASSTNGGSTMPPRDYIGQLTERLNAHRDRQRAIEAIARAEGRELEADELDELESIEQAIPNLEATIARGTADRDRRTLETTAASRATSSTTTTTTSRPVYSGPGAFLRDLSTIRRGGAGVTEARERFERALADVTTGDAPGLIPSTITGPVLGGFATRRPLVESLTAVSIGSAGMTMIRPELTGGDVDEQETEKTQVATAPITIDPQEYALKTYAGGVDVSWQLIERSSPAALDLIFRRLANRYARRTEIVAAAAFLASITTDPEGIATLDGAGVIAALVAAAGTIASEEDVDAFPETLWLSLSAWAKFASIVADDGRPLFPLNGGGISLGLGGSDQFRINPVIVPRFGAADVAILGTAEYAERYELGGSPVEFRAIDATRLGTDVSVAGLFAIGVTNPAAFVPLTFPGG